MASHRRNCMKALSLLLVLLCLTMLPATASVSTNPPQDTPRKIVSDDFTKKRQEAAASTVLTSKRPQGQASNGIPSKRTQPRRTYRLASSPAVSRTRPTSKSATVAQLGITIWRLRPAGANDTGARMLMREKGNSSNWVPERVEADTIFHEGDRVRISVESSRVGYLYVVDRDLLKDGATGDALLIYPWVDTASADNQVGPGKLIDIPAQEDDPSFFTARLTSPNQVGEVLTFIVTSTPLALPISSKPLQISNRDLEKWEQTWGAASERYEMEGGAGEGWTKQEQQAGARIGTRQLTREDPGPQTIYRIPTSDHKAILVNVRLRYAK